MLPLFETATVAARIQFAVDFPLTNVFVHWFVGTCYMFHFALFVSMCRKIMRTGVLRKRVHLHSSIRVLLLTAPDFIRDPDDPTFHPVRDVLNRPVLTQLRKIGFSAFIYGILVLVCLGGVVWGLYGTTQAVLPIHWSSNEPVFEFPVDLLFYNFLMPLAIKFFKPSDTLQNLYEWWFRCCARALRLSSFMFGERQADEEGHTCHPTWTSFLLREKADPGKPVALGDPIPNDRPYFRHDGSFVRAPASDSIRRPKGTPVFIPVDENNRRFDVDPSLDTGPTGPNNPDWRLAYIPPYFKVRIAIVVVGVWFFAACTGVSVTIVPLILGRYLLRQLVPAHVRLNDIYAFSVGVYLLGSIALVLSNAPTVCTHLKTLIQPITTAASNATYPEKLSNFLKTLREFTFRTAKIGYVLTAFAIVIPTLVAMIIELYFIIPLHTAFDATPTTSPSATATSLNTTIIPPALDPSASEMHLPHTIHFVQDWTLGVLYVKMMGKMMLLDDNSVWARSLRGIIQHGWLNPDAMLATRVFIAPCVGGMVAALLLPLAFARLAVLVGLGEGVRVYRYAFPAVMVAAIAAGGVYAAWKVVERWKENVRDEVYLRGMRIHNHGEEGKIEIAGR
jgi:E3 ubiquitin-protein ligase MARCH6